MVCAELEPVGSGGGQDGTPGSAAAWGLPFKPVVRNGELRALPKRHLPGRSELSDGSEPHVPHHVPPPCALRVTPQGLSLGPDNGGLDNSPSSPSLPQSSRAR